MKMVTAGTVGVSIAALGYAWYRYWKSNQFDVKVVEPNDGIVQPDQLIVQKNATEESITDITEYSDLSNLNEIQNVSTRTYKWENISRSLVK